MKWVFRKIPLRNRKAFTLIEVTVALIILGMITATVLVVVNRAIDTVVLWQTKMQAFDIARENMEKILVQSAVSDSVEYGISEENPDITWETTVESFYEPITNNMWVRAVCSAEFTDDNGEEQKIELTHWLTSLSKEQVLQILEQKQRESEYYEAMAENAGQESQDQQQTEQSQQVNQLQQQANQMQQQAEQIQQQAEQLQQQAEQLQQQAEQPQQAEQQQAKQQQAEQLQQQAEQLQRQAEQLQHQAEQLQRQAEQLQRQAEQSQQDEEAVAWKEIESWLGPPPEGYQHWGQVPEEQFWKAVMENLFKNK
jgi:prepilin-type N-terminal cleavage/methylation domain-containing protein